MKISNFETAKLAKEKGFKIPTRHYYEQALKSKKNKEDGYSGTFGWKKGETNLQDGYNVNQETNTESYWYVCSAPFQTQIQDWLRETHSLNIYVTTTPTFGKLESHKSKYKAHIEVLFQPFKSVTMKYYLGDTHEEALEKALLEAIIYLK